MQVDVIDDLKRLGEVKANWEALYDADPETQIFLSFYWINTWLTKIKDPWIVLAVKPSAKASNYVAFLPLQPKTEMKKEGGFYNDYKMGGAEFADYYGLLCHPDHEEAAIEALAEHIKTLNWTNFKLEKFRASDRRIHLFTKHFAKPKFATKDVERFMNGGTINTQIFPYAKLPGDWETYLNNSLSSNTRQKVKRFLKKADEGSEFRVGHADKDTFKRDLETLLKYWSVKWAQEKGNKLAGIVQNNRIMMTASFEENALILPSFWKGDKALAALAILLDRKKRAAHFFIGGRDETFNSPPPGFILHAHSIRWAIQNGFETYDFLMGNEPYKYMWGAEDRYVRTVILSTKSGENLGGKLDKKCLPFVLDRVTELNKQGKLTEAAIGLRQILDVDPRHAEALNLLAQLEAGRAHHLEAHKLYKAYVAERPEDHAAWFRMGKNAQALKDTDTAVQCYRKVIELDPTNREAPSLLIELQLKTSRAKPAQSPVSILSR